MEKLIKLIQENPIGFIRGRFRTNICADDLDNEKLAQKELTIIFEKDGDFLGKLVIPWKDHVKNGNLVTGSVNMVDKNLACYGDFTLSHAVGNISHKLPGFTEDFSVNFDFIFSYGPTIGDFFAERDMEI